MIFFIISGVSLSANIASMACMLCWASQNLVPINRPMAIPHETKNRNAMPPTTNLVRLSHDGDDNADDDADGAGALMVMLFIMLIDVIFILLIDVM